MNDAARALFDDPEALHEIEAALPAAIAGRRWFGAKSRTITSLEIVDVIALPTVTDARIMLATIHYREGQDDTYLLPLRVVDTVADATSFLFDVQCADGVTRALIDACHDEATASALLDAIANSQALLGAHGIARGVPTAAFSTARGEQPLQSALWRREGSNSSIVYGDRLMLKLFRRPEVGINPDWELGRFLTDRAHFTHVPPTAGAIEYTDSAGNTRTLGLLQQLVTNDGDARQQFIAGLRDFFTEVAVSDLAPTAFAELRHESDLAQTAAPALAQAMFGNALEHARTLGHRTAEMHLAFASADGDLAPTPFTDEYQRELYQSTHDQLHDVLELIGRRKQVLANGAERLADRLLAIGDDAYERLRPVRDDQIDALRIRVHGDYHLEQVLAQANDYVILDFEGEPSASLTERRIKRSPLKDVAGMLRSFDYAARPVLNEMPHSDSGKLSAACSFWTAWVGGAFLDGYLTTGGDALLPEGRAASEALLRGFLLEKAAYEVQYELNNRPTWVDIPLRGIVDQLASLPS